MRRARTTWGAMINFEQKSKIENRERKVLQKFHQDQTTVKCSKLGKKNCGRRWDVRRRTNPRQIQISPILKYHKIWSKTDFDIPFKIMGWYSQDLAVYDFAGQSKLGKGSNATCEKRLGCLDASCSHSPFRWNEGRITVWMGIDQGNY